MPCDRFEDRLAGYGELSAEERHTVDAHVSACADCHEFLETLIALDQSLTTLYRAVEPARPFNPASVREPSALPELLDFCGWAAVVAILVFLSVAASARFGFSLALPPNAIWYAAAGVATLALLTRLTLRRL
jgi:anti-sigma factor RsiW